MTGIANDDLKGIYEPEDANAKHTIDMMILMLPAIGIQTVQQEVIQIGCYWCTTRSRRKEDCEFLINRKYLKKEKSIRNRIDFSLNQKQTIYST